mmetsp:Transcript_92118/g.298241  ORF Transcript_92118/g.298241 Transcript_92118/m.298241 type:complete len:256 (-) Transcript_92118:723-1490(-)
MTGCSISRRPCAAVMPFGNLLLGGGFQAGSSCSLATCSFFSWILLARICCLATVSASCLIISLVCFASCLTWPESSPGTRARSASAAGAATTSPLPSTVLAFSQLSSHCTSLPFCLSSTHFATQSLPTCCRWAQRLPSAAFWSFSCASCSAVMLFRARPADFQEASHAFAFACSFLASLWFRCIASWISLCTLPYLAMPDLARAITAFTSLILSTSAVSVCSTLGVRAPFVALKARLMLLRWPKTNCSCCWKNGW